MSHDRWLLGTALAALLALSTSHAAAQVSQKPVLTLAAAEAQKRKATVVVTEPASVFREKVRPSLPPTSIGSS